MREFMPQAPKPKQKPKTKNYRWIVFFVLAAGYFMVYFHRLCPAVVALDLMRDFKADGALIGLLASAYFYPYALMQIPSGLLSDSWGPRKTVTAFFVLAGVASIVMGFAGSLETAIIARVAVGTGVAMFFVPAMKILTSWFSIAEFAAMTGLLMAMGGTGALGAAAPLALVSEVIGWRGSFEIVGVLTLLVAGAIWVYVRDTPEEEGLPPANPVMASIPGRKKISIGQGMKMVLSEPRFWPLPVWFFCSCGVFFSYGGLWGGPYLMQVYGLTKGEAGSVLSMLAVSLIIGSPLVSVISDKWLKSRKKTIIGCAVMLLVLLLPPTLAPESMSVPMLYVWTLLFGFASGASVIVGFAAVKELFPLEIAGTAVGIGNFFPFFGAAIMQPLAGLILDSRPKGPAGYTPEAYGLVFAFFLVAAALALGAAFFVKETYGRQGA